MVLTPVSARKESLPGQQAPPADLQAPSHAPYSSYVVPAGQSLSSMSWSQTSSGGGHPIGTRANDQGPQDRKRSARGPCEIHTSSTPFGLFWSISNPRTCPHICRVFIVAPSSRSKQHAHCAGHERGVAELVTNSRPLRPRLDVREG